jgi:DNA-directed RNA polymerase subunit alpha
MLTNLPGLSIVGLRILGVNHEFSVLEGVREDVLELLLNLKEIIFKSKEEKQESFIGRLKIYGPSIVTASNLKLPTNVKVVNPNQYIATVMEKGFFEMEIKLEWGKGYLLAKNNNIKDSFDFLSVDAIFMPVLKVNYEVEPFFIGHEEIGENLIFNLWTNGSISPQEAIFKASIFIANWFNQFCQEKIFINLKIKKELKEQKQTEISWIKLIKELDKIIKLKKKKELKKDKIIKLKKRKKVKKDKIIKKKISIDELKLSTRLYNLLKKVHIQFIEELLNFSTKDLLKMKGIGPKSIQEIVKVFQEKFKIYFK